MKSYVVKGEFVKVINAESEEEAGETVAEDLTLGYDCDDVKINYVYEE